MFVFDVSGSKGEESKRIKAMMNGGKNGNTTDIDRG